MSPEEHFAFLEGLSDRRLHQHMREYVKNGMDEQAARCDIEITRRRAEK